jgi:hypothetical protein
LHHSFWELEEKNYQLKVLYLANDPSGIKGK